jgi:hypothetical protein
MSHAPARPQEKCTLQPVQLPAYSHFSRLNSSGLARTCESDHVLCSRLAESVPTALRNSGSTCPAEDSASALSRRTIFLSNASAPYSGCASSQPWRHQPGDHPSEVAPQGLCCTRLVTHIDFVDVQVLQYRFPSSVQCCPPLAQCQGAPTLQRAAPDIPANAQVP